MRNAPPIIRPPIPDNNPPSVQSLAAAGLGAGRAAYVVTPGGDGYGRVVLRTGNAPLGSTAGQIAIAFASIPPNLTFLPDPAFGTLTIVGQGTTGITLQWTSAAAFQPNTEYWISYEWTVSL